MHKEIVASFIATAMFGAVPVTLFYLPKKNKARYERKFIDSMWSKVTESPEYNAADDAGKLKIYGNFMTTFGK